LRPERDHEFEYLLLEQGVRCEADFREQIPSLSLPASERHPLPNPSPQRKKERTLEALTAEEVILAPQTPGIREMSVRSKKNCRGQENPVEGRDASHEYVEAQIGRKFISLAHWLV
jgi:hypothetical protein